MLSIGLMSGTSMDGIDAALLDTNGHDIIHELGFVSIIYSPEFKILLKAAEFAVLQAAGDLKFANQNFFQMLGAYLQNEMQLSTAMVASTILQLSIYLKQHQPNEVGQINLNQIIKHSTKLHLETVQHLLQQLKLRPQQIAVIGYHGQTLFHRPALGVTIQVGDAEYLAEQMGIPVVHDFRTKDVAAGGQGAPFAPIYHYALAKRDKMIPVVVVNCGGIANITLINSEDEHNLIGFDTGPGNGLIDRLVRLYTQGQEHMDLDGQYGKAGKVDIEIFNALYQHAIIKDGKNFFDLPPPKSLDYNDLKLIPELSIDNVSLPDACRTLEAFTADTIVNSLNHINVEIPRRWILAGGGWKNPVIRDELESRLRVKLGPQVIIQSADEAGWNSQALEAQVFAYLAVRSLENRMISFPGTTCVSEALSGGQVYYPKNSPW